ncbi:MAG: hypothetical protein K2O73_09160 [Lachnospiraceae bacterium]|nr:hypothetical protein [Lachnospiraceae bacterium]
MNTEKFSTAMNEISDKYIVEALNYRKTLLLQGWVKWSAAAACLAVILTALLAALPDYLHGAAPISPSDHDGFLANHYDQNTLSSESAHPTTIHIDKQGIFINEVTALADAAFPYAWTDPEKYDRIVLDRAGTAGYYGKDLTPAYIPAGLSAGIGNGTANAVREKNGTVVWDTAYLCFYHDYYEDGSPKLTEDIAATKGFSLTASKTGLLNDCVYILSENDVITSDIGGTAVTFGYRSMSYGPYDSQTHEPSGYYDMYVAEFNFEDIEYQLIATQMELEDVVTIVASIIYGNAEIVIDP